MGDELLGGRGGVVRGGGILDGDFAHVLKEVEIAVENVRGGIVL